MTSTAAATRCGTTHQHSAHREPFRFGVPRPEDLEFFGCEQGPPLFDEAIRRLVALGGEAVPLDLSPFLEAARLLYDGPWVAGRYSVAGALMESRRRRCCR